MSAGCKSALLPGNRGWLNPADRNGLAAAGERGGGSQRHKRAGWNGPAPPPPVLAAGSNALALCGRGKGRDRPRRQTALTTAASGLVTPLPTRLGVRWRPRSPVTTILLKFVGGQRLMVSLGALRLFSTGPRGVGQSVCQASHRPFAGGDDCLQGSLGRNQYLTAKH